MPQKSPAVSPVETRLFQLPIRSQERSPLGLLLLMLVLLVGGPGLGGIALGQDGDDAAPVDEAAAPASDDGDEAEVYRMEEGSFPVLSLLRFIQRTTGKFVNYPSAANDVAFAEDTTVDVIGDVDPLTYPVIKAILETNGYELWESELEDGTTVINVRSASPRGGQSAPVDPVSPIYVADDEEAIKAPGEELATLVLQLKFTTAQVVRTALQELLGIAGAGNASGSVKIVTVPENETMLIRAKMRVLEHIQRVVKYIDVEVTGPDQSLSIRELYYADAQSIVSIVTEALSEFSPTAVSYPHLTLPTKA